MKLIHYLSAVAIAAAAISCGTTSAPDTSVRLIPEAAGSRFCNPLPMEIGPGGNASGDVSVFEHEGKYYMFCTGGGAWVSTDMTNWKHQHVEGRIPVAPDVAYYNGRFYMTGNDSPVYVADDPLGPYELYSDWKDAPSIEQGWNGAFDTHIYIDDDNKPYLFWPGRGISGIYGCALDPDDLSRFVGPVQHLFGFNAEHEWERYGEMNEYQGVAWIEGPWVFKHNGTYYIQYSASGTQWKTYAEGYYTAKSPLGPYTYAGNNPLLRKTEGLVTGTAHGSMLKGPDGGIWQFYTIVLSNPPGGRRIGMDRVIVDKDGLLSVEVTDTPQWAPGATADATKGDSGSLPVTINKINAMNALSKFSSQQDGHYATYAVDNNSGTWWMPAVDDEEPSITVELSPATRFDVVELFTIDGIRLMFGGGNRGSRWFGRGEFTPTIYRYKLEVSGDGDNWAMALDKTGSNDSKDTIFEEINPVECRFVRLTITDWPKANPLGLIEFTVFGKATGMLPAAVATPTFSNLPMDGQQK